MKVWEDTWTFTVDEDGWDIWGMDERYRPGTMYGLDEAKLAAAAPEMARLLIDCQFLSDGCPRCGEFMLSGSDLHKKDCKLKAVLVKAGVLEAGDT